MVCSRLLSSALIFPRDATTQLQLSNNFCLYLQRNQLSSEFPTGLTQLQRLNRFNLRSNNFTGPITFSISNLTRLIGLFLENNCFSGKPPSIPSPNLTSFDVSNNKLNSSILQSLSHFPAFAFSGNLNLCGGLLKPCNPFFSCSRFVAHNPNPQKVQ
ncbi:hypothetical protein TB2_025138 [Malus domestica]